MLQDESLPFDGSECPLPTPLFQIEPAHTVVLDNGHKKAIIDFDGDKVTYSGDLRIGEAAKLFFEAVCQLMRVRCKTCHWFKGSMKDDLEYSCDCPKMHYTYCSSAWAAKNLRTDDVLIENDEGWGMVPGPDFGCIHHKEKS